MNPIPARQRNPPYRITMVEREWHVARPHASLVHAFGDLDEALAFVRRDGRGAETVVEIVSGNFYMLKPIGPAR
ncbi:hypothetical protein [Reyranella sp.]|uniref:hypothetical protein n=1 Tax=Reyranella sp. TaxID=1929291 RepID=UPI003D143FAA